MRAWPVRTSLLLLAAACAAGTAAYARPQVEPPPAATEAVMAVARGVFDMSANPRPYAVFLVLEQEGNFFPSFWCGRNLSGKLTFNGKMNLLDETISLNQLGSMVVQLTNAAFKHGMREVLPGGAWIATLRENDFRIAFEAFGNPVFKGLKESQISTGQGLTGRNVMALFDVTVRGSVSVSGRTAPFTGTATLGFLDGTQAFTLQASFPLPGEALGLEGPKGAGITATLYTSSATSKVLPDGRDAANDAVDSLLP